MSGIIFVNEKTTFSMRSAYFSELMEILNSHFTAKSIVIPGLNLEISELFKNLELSSLSRKDFAVFSQASREMYRDVSNSKKYGESFIEEWQRLNSALTSDPRHGEQI